MNIENIESACYTESGEITIKFIGGSEMGLTDDPLFHIRIQLAEWEAIEGNTITPYSE